MSVVFSLVFIYCGVMCTLNLCHRSLSGGLIYGSIALLALIALTSMALKTKKKEERENSNAVAMNNNSSINQLKELKELLDSGVITQEEFEKKKKKILDI